MLEEFSCQFLPAAPGLARHAPYTWQEEAVPIPAPAHPALLLWPPSVLLGPKQMGQTSNNCPTTPALP